VGRSATNAELQIALAPESAYEAVLALHHQAGWNPSRVGGEVWGAWEHGELVGSIQFEEVGSPNVLFVGAMVVRDDVRGSGIGAHMFTEVMGTRQAEWWLECSEERIRFYTRMGFELVEGAEIPASVRQLVRPRTDRRQHFMKRSVHQIT
jgi:N-acetylglutamate synthase-like GNAT family acetyltransferase